ncbi:MAG TPA: hypothetical protein VMF90_25420 [Rhizobiaceae bacterium]|nr:hypothetical protein [Rhizobiaceae bacterium]
MNKGRIRLFTSRSEDAHSSSVVSIDAPAIHDPPNHGDPSSQNSPQNATVMLGIAFPRWLENDLRFAKDPLETSLRLCARIFEEVWDYAETKGIPVGVNVESVSIRKDEIDASVESFRRLRRIRNSER